MGIVCVEAGGNGRYFHINITHTISHMTYTRLRRFRSVELSFVHDTPRLVVPSPIGRLVILPPPFELDPTVRSVRFPFAVLCFALTLPFVDRLKAQDLAVGIRKTTLLYATVTPLTGVDSTRKPQRCRGVGIDCSVGLHHRAVGVQHTQSRIYVCAYLVPAADTSVHGIVQHVVPKVIEGVGSVVATGKGAFSVRIAPFVCYHTEHDVWVLFNWDAAERTRRRNLSYNEPVVAMMADIMSSRAPVYKPAFEGIFAYLAVVLLFTASLCTTAHGQSMEKIMSASAHSVAKHYWLILFYASAGGLPAALELRKIESCDLARPAR